MVVGDWEFEYNSLTFGGDLVIGVTSVDGLDPPDFKADIVPKTGAHGSAVFADFYQERHIVIEGDIMDDTPADFEAHVNTLRATFAVRTANTNLIWKFPGFNRRRVGCRPVRIKVPIRLGYDIGMAQWAVELVADDPAIYDDVTSNKLFDG